jgi:hypothetical protein
MNDKELYGLYQAHVLASRLAKHENVVIIVPQYVFAFIVSFNAIYHGLYVYRHINIVFMGKPLIVGNEDLFLICTYDSKTKELIDREEHQTHFDI